MIKQQGIFIGLVATIFIDLQYIPKIAQLNPSTPSAKFFGSIVTS